MNACELSLIMILNIAFSTQRIFGFQPQASKDKNNQRVGGWRL